MDNNIIISLEAGSSSLKIAAATITSPSPLTVGISSLEEEPLSNSVRYGRIQNVEEVTRAAMLALDRISATPALAGSKVTGVYVGIGGRSLGSRHASSELVLPDEDEITAAIIDRLKNDATASVPENREVLSIIPLRYKVDDVETKNPVGAFGRKISGEFTIVVCDPLNARNLERVVVERLNLDICGFIVRPLAIAGISLSIEDTKPGCMLVDLGAETTTVSIFKDCALQYLATIPMGSHNITRDLAEGLGIVDEQAESLKRRLGNVIPDPTAQISPQQREIDSYVQARAGEIIANIIAQIGFSGYTTADLRAGIIITGRGARLKNFCRLLEVQSRLAVRAAMPPSWVRVSDPSINLADNLDIVGVTLEGARLAQTPDAAPCVVPVQQEAAEEPEPQLESETEPASLEDGQTINPFGYSIDEPAYQGSGENRVLDDEFLLEDDETGNEKRRQREEKNRIRAQKEARREAERRQKAAEKAAREAEKAGRFDDPDDESEIPEPDTKHTINLFGRLKRGMENILNSGYNAGNGDGNDLDD